MLYKRSMCLCLSLLCSSVYATNIQGNVEFKLGDTLKLDKLKYDKLSDETGTLYKIPSQKNKAVAYTLIRLTPDKRIHRITEYSTDLSPAQCDTQKNQLKKDTEKKYPKMGYYAMDEAEMFYEDTRTFTIECIVSGKMNRLKLEYADDELAKLK